MRNIYCLLWLIFLFSCNQKKKGKEIEEQNVIEIVTEDEKKSSDSIIPKEEAIVKDEDLKPAFKEIVTSIKTKTLPQIENTSFDSFIEEEDYEDVNTVLFQLENIYPNFNKDGYNYRGIAKYKLALSDRFHSIVITVKKGDNEMESVLINYTDEGEIIDHEVVSYDEIAEGMSQIRSRISENMLTVNHVFWSDLISIEQITHSIDQNGEIKKVKAKKLNQSIKDFSLVNSVLMDLKLDWVQTKTSLIRSQENPLNREESIVVIPRIVDEGEHYFELSSYIVLLNSKTGEITHKYHEVKAEGWGSDAVILDDAKIDIEAYSISETRNALGIRLHYTGSSQVNPYENENLSLFIKSGSTLKKVLHNFDVVNFGGEWVNECAGETVREEKTIIINEEKSNDYFDLVIKNKISIETSSFKIKNGEENGDCDTIVTNSVETSKLKFNGTLYKQEDTDVGVSVLQLMLLTKDQAIKHYGNPKLRERFKLNDAHGEFRNGVSSKFSQEERQNESILIDELTWEKDPNTWVTTWYLTNKGDERPLEVLEWEKGTEF
ncbi:PA3715 family protein [Tenacibaculum xiamenense]|uniref:hypothetical protein n=1 Tax=Tenacibaculum xiamenense TaxID=1261553 RepID=UPI003893B65A